MKVRPKQLLLSLLISLALIFQSTPIYAATTPTPTPAPQAAPVRKLLDKVQLAKLSNVVVKVIYYDINDEEMGNGSGIIVSSDGLVVTNYHVIDMVTKVRVETSDEKLYEVSGVTSYNANSDLAVLQMVGAKGLPVAKLGDPSILQLGEEIAAIGYPLDLTVTVSYGNISSLKTPGGFSRQKLFDIQVSAPISPGSSGGALFNMYGEVVGVTYSTLVNGQNLNYAIPINEVKSMLTNRVVKTLATVIKEVYPKMTLNQFEKWFYYNEPMTRVGLGRYDFRNIEIIVPSDAPDVVVVSLTLNAAQYAWFLVSRMLNETQNIDKWLRSIHDRVKAIEPTKRVFIAISLLATFSQRPAGYPNESIFYDEDEKTYYISYFKMSTDFNNGAAIMKWN